MNQDVGCCARAVIAGSNGVGNVAAWCCELRADFSSHNVSLLCGRIDTFDSEVSNFVNVCNATCGTSKTKFESRRNCAIYAVAKFGMSIAVSPGPLNKLSPFKSMSTEKTAGCCWSRSVVM